VQEVVLSIITVCHNDVENLKKTTQTIREAVGLINCLNKIEHIIVDGNSSDSTDDFIRTYKSEAQYKVDGIVEADNGLYDAMNKGARIASGRFIQFLNAGDFLVIENFSEVMATLEAQKDPRNIVCMSYFLQPEQGPKRFIPARKRVTRYFLRMPTSHQAIFYPSNIMYDFPYDLRYRISADFNQWCRIVLSGYSYVSACVPAVIFAQGGISSRFRKQLFLESARSIVAYNFWFVVPLRLAVLAVRIFR
jgi:putative colanic acid biosynthesis glycosyltransferase